jgi:uncharacterized membrane protein
MQIRNHVFTAFGVLHGLLGIAFLVLSIVYVTNTTEIITAHLTYRLNGDASAYAFTITTPISKNINGVLCMFMYFFGFAGLITMGLDNSKTYPDESPRIPYVWWSFIPAIANLLVLPTIGINSIEYLIPAFFCSYIGLSSLGSSKFAGNNSDYYISRSIPMAGLFIIANLPVILSTQIFGTFQNSPFNVNNQAAYQGFEIGYFVLMLVYSLALYLGSIFHRLAPFSIDIFLTILITILNAYLTIYYIPLAVNTNYLNPVDGIQGLIAYFGF